MANTYVTVTTPSGNQVHVSDATTNKVVSSGNTVVVTSVGTQGPAGAGDSNAVHTQGSAASTWQVTHNLGKYPSVTVVDSAENFVIGTVLYKDWDTNATSTNKLQIIFEGSFTGKAFLN
tara:strand:- start:206 stop:562 length:357 start_codon:yes stop_codon:yes gene_type:complete